MEQLPLMHEDLYDALRDVVRALGGSKAVGPMLWPAKPPLEARNLLNDCLNRDRREKLDPEQLMFLLQKAKDVGCYAAMNYLADQAGYDRPRARTRGDERRVLEEQVVQAAKLLDRVTKRLESLEFGGD